MFRYQRSLYNEFGRARPEMSRAFWGWIFVMSAMGVFIAGTMTYYHYSVPERRERVAKIFPFIQRLYPEKESPSEAPVASPPSAGVRAAPGFSSQPLVDLFSDRPNLPFCDVSGRLNCAKVDESRYSVFLGVPVPLLGLLGYLQFFLISGAGLFRPLLNRILRRYFLIIAVFALLFTGYLNLVEAFVIHAFCPWCIGSALVTLGISIPALLKSKSLWIG